MDKCEFGKDKINFLRNSLSQERIESFAEKVRAIEDFPATKIIKTTLSCWTNNYLSPIYTTIFKIMQ